MIVAHSETPAEMLFNSYEFILVFLPVTIFGFFFLGQRGYHRSAISFLVVASLFFYGWWNPVYLTLIVFSMLFNYSLGLILTSRRRPPDARATLVLGLAVNLGLLGYFKYANFFVDNLDSLAGIGIGIDSILLPLAISFFTFQQITYIVDAYRGQTREYRFIHYCLFVTFFPQLIAGPIVHHREMLPQFARSGIFRIRWTNIAVGVTIFSIGLFKKAVLADGIAQYATPVFSDAASGIPPTFFEAWGGALAYTMQLYFDFSGYSDMAIGAARLVGIRLPLNFYSPYKATSIIDFWRRWHMTLSRFLRDYVYIPLGGNRRGEMRRNVNVIVTMLLGGLWHGAGWTFVVWGGLHGLYLAINHGWRALCKRIGVKHGPSTWWGRSISWLITFMAIVVAWVFFRAADFDTAQIMLEGMVGLNGVAIPAGVAARLGISADLLGGLGIELNHADGMNFALTYVWITALVMISLLAPNSMQITFRYRPCLDVDRTNTLDVPAWFTIPIPRWRMTGGWGITTALITGAALLALSQVSEFLYFQF